MTRQTFLGFVRHLATALGLAWGASAALAGPPPSLFRRDFQSAEGGEPGPGWQLLNGEWRVEGGDDRALRQVTRPLLQEAFALASWSAPEVACTFRATPGPGRWGAGLVAHCVQADRYYALAIIGDELHLLRRKDGWVSSLAKAAANHHPGQWHSLRLTLSLEGGKLSLTGKLWQGEEPQKPSVVATDETPLFLRGTVGAWCANADCAFDRLELRGAGEGDGGAWLVDEFEDPGEGELPGRWEATKGRWLADHQDGRGVLRHPGGGREVSFDQNALSLLRPRDYTVVTRLRRDADDRVWGAGVVAYCQSPDSHYRLRTIGDKLYLTKRWDAEHAHNLAETRLPLKPGRWYQFRLTVRSLRDGAQLFGRVWSGEEEPDQWTLTAFDSAQPLSGGTAGIWAFGAPSSFDDFTVEPAS